MGLCLRSDGLYGHAWPSYWGCSARFNTKRKMKKLARVEISQDREMARHSACYGGERERGGEPGEFGTMSAN